MLTKFLVGAQLLSLLAIGCYALSLTEVRGNITVSFGKADPQEAFLASTLKASEVRPVPARYNLATR